MSASYGAFYPHYRIPRPPEAAEAFIAKEVADPFGSVQTWKMSSIDGGAIAEIDEEMIETVLAGYATKNNLSAEMVSEIRDWFADIINHRSAHDDIDLFAQEHCLDERARASRHQWFAENLSHRGIVVLHRG